MDTVNNVEDQPLPADDDGARANAAFQESINDLGRQLMRKFQQGGNQFNALELELRVFILVEQVNLLTKIIQGMTHGYSDVKLTEQMTAQVTLLTKTLGEALTQAPRIVAAGGAPPSKLNGGSRHN